MNILKRLLGSSEPDLTEQARNLLPSAQGFAITSYSTVANNFQSIQAVDPAHWDFILTVGAIFVAFRSLTTSIFPNTRKIPCLTSSPV
jgi:hypothetical protein